jgi:Leu/Phe-tRNA-protein transferase
MAGAMKLVGGLYGIKIGKVFFGESMFSKVSNASKFAFINYVKQLQSEGIELIDCQVYTFSSGKFRSSDDSERGVCGAAAEAPLIEY